MKLDKECIVQTQMDQNPAKRMKRRHYREMDGSCGSHFCKISDTQKDRDHVCLPMWNLDYLLGT